MAYYTCILIDLDNTLLDFNSAERSALYEMLEEFQLPADNRSYEVYHALNRELWDELAKGTLTKNKLFSVRFDRFLQRLGVPSNGKGREMNDFYEACLANQSALIPGAIYALQELSEVSTIAVVSNGAEKVQISRIQNSGMETYLDDIYISEKIGAEKPSPRIFEHAIHDLEIQNKSRVLVVGDDLLADIKGGINSGLDTCWFNPDFAKNETDIIPKFEVHSYDEIFKIVMEPDEFDNIGSRNRRHMAH